MWETFGNNINDSFYFVIDKIADMMTYFLNVSRGIGRIVLLIALLTAALNYILTGTGLKENLIKILKATLFFLIVTSLPVYTKIISTISDVTFNLAKGSVYKTVSDHFNRTTDYFWDMTISVPTGTSLVEEEKLGYNGNSYHFDKVTIAKTNHVSLTQTIVSKLKLDKIGLFNNITENHNHKKTGINFTIVAPANVMKIIFFLASECIKYAEKDNSIIPEFSRILKGLVCAGVLIFTGSFALLEYIVCFLEFILVASVGMILLPMAIWEGSKFLAEGFIKAVLGFTVKLLFCNLAIFLCLYGFITLFYIISAKHDGNTEVGFQGNPEQIIFIVFSSLLFFFICKFAPGVAQSLIPGSPSLTGAGAIGAVAGAVGAVAAVGGMAKSAGSKLAGAGGSLVGGSIKAHGALSEANAASKAAKDLGGGKMDQAGAFMKSMGKQASQGLARSLYGDHQSNNRSLGQINDARRQDGAETGLQHMASKDK